MPAINMVEIISLLERAGKAGIKISRRNNELALRVNKGIIPDNDLLAEIKSNKQQLVEYFSLLETHESATQSTHPLHAYNREEYPRIPLSFEQERLWFIDQWHGSQQYHVPWILRLTGHPDIAALEYAFREIVSRHEILRTQIREKEGEGYQNIMPPGQWQLQCLRQQDIPAGKTTDEYVDALLLQPFDLSRDYMLKATLISLENDQHLLVIVLHHIAFDGWSIGIFSQEFQTLYNNKVRGTDIILNQLPVQYADYAIWQRARVSGQSAEAGIAYWKHKLTGFEPLNLCTDFPRTSRQDTLGKVFIKKISKELWSKVTTLSNKERVTPFMVLLSVCNILLYRYSGQQDICVGSPIAGRQSRELEGLIGFFINTIVLRTDISGNPVFTELLQRIKETTLGAYEHQDIPIEKVVQSVVKDRLAGGDNLVRVLFVLQNTPEASELELDNLKISEKPFIQTTSKFDVSFFITEAAGEIKIGIEYNTSLFQHATIRRMADHFERLLADIVQSPGKRLGELKMLTKDEEEQIVIEFNNTLVNRAENGSRTIIDFINEQAGQNPDAIAVEFENTFLSYAALHDRSNQLAACLQFNGVAPDTRVAVCIEKGLDMPVALLAVLKAGGAYVPIDPDLPEERILNMLLDSEAAIVLTSITAEENVPGVPTIRVVRVEEAWNNGYNLTGTDFFPDPSQLAYLIYTSGSTGFPKGVMIDHSSLLNYCLAFKEYFSVTRYDRVIQQSSLSFDTLVEELFPALMSGACVCIVRDGGRDIDTIKKYIEHKGATILSTTPTVLRWLNRELESTGTLRYIISGGEMLHSSCIDRLFGKTTIVNTYGPSETTVCATYHTINDLSTASIIGKPIANTKVYITGIDGELNKIGVTGELCIGGSGVGRGYWNRPILTEQKFIDDTYTNTPGKKLYRTGDLARWLPDGNIEYIGRKDDQTKIRGYRVEPGEIEQVLLESGKISEAAVITRQGQNGLSQLVAYIVPENRYDDNETIGYLKKRLPDYMIPAIFHQMDRLPLLSNGKIDRRSLPDPDVGKILSHTYVAPQNETEEQLVRIWEELLNLERIGTMDNFFVLGGHSLLATRLIAVIRREMQTVITVGDLFEMLTIKQLSDYIAFSRKDETEFESAHIRTLKL